MTFRACLKKAFRELRVPVCGRFYPNEGGVAGYGNRMRVKYTAKWGVQIAKMIFQTRSSITKIYPPASTQNPQDAHRKTDTLLLVPLAQMRSGTYVDFRDGQLTIVNLVVVGD